MSSQKITNNFIINTEKNNILAEKYEPSEVISPIFGLNHQPIVSSKTKLQKTNNTSATLEQYLEQKTKDSIISEKVESYTNTISLDKSRVAQIEKTKKQQVNYDTLPSRYLEFREKITTKVNQTINYSPNNDTIITTIDLLVDDILDEK